MYPTNPLMSALWIAALVVTAGAAIGAVTTSRTPLWVALIVGVVGVTLSFVGTARLLIDLARAGNRGE